MTRNNRAAAISRNDYPVVVVIVGAAVLAASVYATANDFALFIMPLSIALIGVGIVLTIRKDDAGLRRQTGLARYQRFILFSIAMLLLVLFAYALAGIITSQQQ